MSLLSVVGSIVGGSLVLAFAANRFIAGSVGLARNFGVPTMMIGLIVLGFGTAAPEFLIAVVASAQNSSEIAIGTAFGTNIVNLALVLGVTAIISPLVIKSTALRREFPLMVVAIGAVFYVLDDNIVSRLDGLLLWGGLVGLLYWMSRIARDSSNVDPLRVEIDQEMQKPGISKTKSIIFSVVGMVGLLIGAYFIVAGAIETARALELSELVIAVTIVSLATSLPMITISVYSAMRKEPDLAIGNIFGANIFNLLGVVGVSGLISPQKVDPWALQRDLILVLFLTLFVFLIARSKPSEETIIQRWEGGVLVVVYLGYLWLMYVTTMG